MLTPTAQLSRYATGYFASQDLTMLVVHGGLERTNEEFERLFYAAGFRLTMVIRTAAEVSVLQGERI